MSRAVILHSLSPLPPCGTHSTAVHPRCSNTLSEAGCVPETAFKAWSPNWQQALLAGSRW